MKSAEFWKFPGHITLPNARKPFWGKNTVTDWKKFGYFYKFTSLNYGRVLFQLIEKKPLTVASKSNLINLQFDLPS